MRFPFTAFLGAIVSFHCAAANTPRHMNRVVCAVKAPICARAYIERNETVVERSISKTRSRQQLWSFPAWLNIVRVDESGDHLLVESTALGVLPENVSPDLVVLQVYRRGELQRQVKLHELFPTEASLQSALKVGAWGKVIRSPESGTAKYLLASGSILLVNLSTGEAHTQ